jgi:hypothetical protein
LLWITDVKTLFDEGVGIMQLLENKILKIQFKLDQLPLPYRAMAFGGVLVVLSFVWYIFVYSPQASQMASTQKEAKVLKKVQATLSDRNRILLEHVSSNDMKPLIDQYKQLKREINVLEEEIQRYRYRYVSDKVLAELLHALLKDVSNIRIERFVTVLREKTVMAKSAARADAASSSGSEPSDTKVASAEPNALLLSPEITRYSLSLKGDYASITKFLKRIEQLKWQLFWSKFTYHVEKHPEAIAVIEFYTLKERSTPDASVAADDEKK